MRTQKPKGSESYLSDDQFGDMRELLLMELISTKVKVLSELGFGSNTSMICRFGFDCSVMGHAFRLVYLRSAGGLVIHWRHFRASRFCPLLLLPVAGQMPGPRCQMQTWRNIGAGRNDPATPQNTAKMQRARLGS